jgi:transposase
MEAKIEDIDYEALKALIARVEYAIENELALETDDLRLLLIAINTLATVQSRLEDNDITLHKLRKLLGMVTSSEKRPSSDNQNNANQKKPPRKKPKPATKPTPKETLYHKLKKFKKGDPCPECPKGKLAKYIPLVLLRISGSAPLKAVKHIIERLKCNLCDYVVSASLPDEVLKDGDANQQYGYSARSIMAIYKHFSGVPYFHQSTLNKFFGCPVTASTIFDQCEHLTNDIMPVFYEIKRRAADAKLFLIDDTHNLILTQKPEERPKRNGKGTQMRSGVFTSGLIAMLQTEPEEEQRSIYLYNTSLGHAGEFLDEIASQRNPGLPPPIIMSDALSRNLPTKIESPIIAFCNSHARRMFVDIENNYPEESKYVVNLYKKIWKRDKEAKELGYNDDQRLAYHKEKSLPAMEEIKSWCEAYQQSESYEEHSGLGKACKYFLKHYERLTQFCKVPGCPIDNNKMEEGLKVKIRTRKNAHFYKTANGAGVANVLITVISTAHRNGVNIFDYLNELQRNKEAVKANPSAWLPWSRSWGDLSSSADPPDPPV